MAEADFLNLLSGPFMHRALLGGMLTGALGGVLGSFAVLRQLSFYLVRSRWLLVLDQAQSGLDAHSNEQFQQ